MLFSHDLAVIDVPYARKEYATARIWVFVVDRTESMGLMLLPSAFKPFKSLPPLDSILMGHWLIMETEIEQTCTPDEYAVCPNKIISGIVENHILLVWRYGETTRVLSKTGTPDLLSEGNETRRVAQRWSRVVVHTEISGWT